MSITPDPVAPGQQSVWDYPRPAIAEPSTCHLVILHGGRVIADTLQGVRTLETSHPPSYYFPPDAILPGILRRSARQSWCEWKGHATYWDVVLDDMVLPDIGWSYGAPTPAFAVLRDHIAFYAAPLEGCYVDGERVVPQPGGFYGGWITPDLAGPFKGVPGSRYW